MVIDEAGSPREHVDILPGVRHLSTGPRFSAGLFHSGVPIRDAFQPDDVKAMSMALDDLCKELKLDGNANAKETIAVRIIELARCGERSPTKLRDRVLREANHLIA